MMYDEHIATARDAQRRGALNEALDHFESALACITGEGAEAAEARASVHRWMGSVHRELGDLDSAHASYELSMAVAEEAGQPVLMAYALNATAIVLQFRGDLTAAEEAYGAARKMSDCPGGERVRAMVDLNQATLASIRGDLARAIATFRDAVQRFRELRDEHSEISAINNLGMAHRDRGEWHDAERCFDEGFVLAHRLRDTTLLGNVEMNRAQLWLAQNDYERARECCDRAFEIYTRTDSAQGLGEAYKVYGALFTRAGKPSLAGAHLDRALTLATTAGDRLLEAEILAQRAQLHLVTGDNAAALETLNSAYRIFSELGAQAALLDLERRLDGLEETYLQVVAAWARSIDAKDAYTAGHCGRVADFACALAEAYGISGRELTWFRMGAFLHDVGKTEVPLEVLNKPGRLTEEEFAIIQQHTVAGARIVEKLNFPWPILPLVRNHHERWDGTGYPDKLAGEDIPLHARILCIADVYDALTSARAYRPALPAEEALRIMTADAGRGLDPTLFELFKEVLAADSNAPAQPALRIMAA
jgi:putative nucleotidyltransferase with HDIG domain